ncbi:hypothetical protein [Gracilimonas mengyeensis]|uniref:Uncharacterized protein n=1 Tax=Gracilimonas mengyeensis TaxID=1302730 RepID=A0A521BHW2_9BACT|nr:hypothetical protein [Gracilimonas mengyeensis]SMO46629.1 hypothetical protein SAMN06265219_102295 [Gracilimonas mengyeensis]
MNIYRMEERMGKPKSGCLSTIKKVFIASFIVLGIVMAGMALYNLSLPEASPYLSELSDTEQNRLSEITHLRKTLGNEVWPGWGDQEIPILLYNESYAFLTGIDDPAPGWKKVPYSSFHGTYWEATSGKMPYFRQPLPENGETPQAFIVQIGYTFAASMTTKTWTQIQLIKMIRDDLPNILKPVMPYQLLVNKFDSDWHVAGILHESFHAFQANVAYDRLLEAEKCAVLEDTYPWNDAAFRNKWVEERRLLAKAIEEKDPRKFKQDVQQWLIMRQDRQSTIDSTLVHYEKNREWLEGMAKYAELNIWLKASEESYKPLPGMQKDDDFSFYQNANDHKVQEIRQLSSDLSFSETMFYYSGWAQAEILDRLYPNWRSLVFEPDVFLDDLIAESMEGQPVAEHNPKWKLW